MSLLISNICIGLAYIAGGFAGMMLAIAPSNASPITIIAMAQHLNLKVVAEGIETEQQFTFLREKGCFGFQGYYLSKPVPADQFTRLLQKPDPAGVS